MFYDQLMKICKERNVKPTPLVKSLGLSAGNLKRWQEGATVNCTLLCVNNAKNVCTCKAKALHLQLV